MTDESILSAIDQQILYHRDRAADYVAAKEILLAGKSATYISDPPQLPEPQLPEPAPASVSAKDLMSVWKVMTTPPKKTRKKKSKPTRFISPAGRARIAAAQKKRWAKVKREKKLAGKETRG